MAVETALVCCLGHGVVDFQLSLQLGAVSPVISPVLTLFNPNFVWERSTVETLQFNVR
jgi:hypothetical protein